MVSGVARAPRWLPLRLRRFMQAVVASWCERGIGSSTSSKMRRMGDDVGAGSDPPPPRPPAAERRPEDSERAVATAAKLGLSFLLKVMPCAQSRRLFFRVLQIPCVTSSYR